MHKALLNLYVSPVASEIYDEYNLESWQRWTEFTLDILIYCQKLLDAKIKMPETWEEILKPEFKKEVSVAHPGASGFTILCLLH